MNTIMFDLDGTLLPMDQDLFIKQYFKGLLAHFEPKEYSKDALIHSMQEGTKAMLANDGSTTNEERFWSKFSETLGINGEEMEPEFYEFYKNGFQKVKETTAISSHAARCIKKLKEKNYTIVIATNPLFPPVATYSRIAWAGLNPEDFVHITTYDNSRYCKPNIDYYKEILETIGKEPSECMMVGNDVSEDMCAHKLGLDTYLITDCLLNTKNLPTEHYKAGTFNEFELFIDGLPEIN